MYSEVHLFEYVAYYRILSKFSVCMYNHLRGTVVIEKNWAFLYIYFDKSVSWKDNLVRFHLFVFVSTTREIGSSLSELYKILFRCWNRSVAWTVSADAHRNVSGRGKPDCVLKNKSLRSSVLTDLSLNSDICKPTNTQIDGSRLIWHLRLTISAKRC